MTALASRPPQTAADQRRGPWHVVAPFFTGLLAAAAAAALYVVFVRTSLGQVVDTKALHGADVRHAQIVTVLERTLDGTTGASLILVCIAVAAIGLMRKRLDLAVAAAFLVLAANGSALLLKDRLTRPDLDGFPAPNSFPSGHTTAAASVAFALILVLPHAIRGLVTLIGAGYVTIIAVATVWAAWHRPSDTVAGLLLVLAWGSVVCAVLRAKRYSRPGPLARVNRTAKGPLIIVGTITALGGLAGLGALIVSERVTTLGFTGGRFAFFAAAACITAAVAGCFLVWVRVAAGDQAPVSDPVPDSE